MHETRKGRVLRTAAIWALICWSILPFAFMLRVGFAAPSDIHGGAPDWLAPLYVFNVVDLFGDTEFMGAIGRSVLVAVVSSAIAIAAATPAAYACARMQFKGRSDFEFWVLSTRMLPAVVVVIPYFVLFRQIGGIDTVWALTVMHTVVNLAVTFFLLRSFFADLPAAVFEAADLDGCSETKKFMSVAWPMVRNGVAAAAVLNFIFSWNEFVFALTLASGEAKTVSVAMLGFMQFQSVAVGPMMAAGTLAVLPVAVVLFLAQKQLVTGMSFGAVKG
ncbi:carbohydrate ABC transporter permease [Micromonospora gifhornensis]|uniref:carbohydrate ABC transporter permease n=1 Tax=Micromonospora gifhornensis TaxID=84594 RepID=UPI003D71A517